MPLVSYSDGGYIKSGLHVICNKVSTVFISRAGGDYWFIVGPCPDSDAKNVETRVKVGFHRQVRG